CGPDPAVSPCRKLCPKDMRQANGVPRACAPVQSRTSDSRWIQAHIQFAPASTAAAHHAKARASEHRLRDTWHNAAGTMPRRLVRISKPAWKTRQSREKQIDAP